MEDKVINKIDVTLTYNTSSESTQSINIILTAPNYTDTQTITFSKGNGKTGTVTFENLNIGINDMFSIQHEKNSLNNNKINITSETMKIYYAN